MSTSSPTKDVLRLEALARYRILDTPPEEPFDRLARLAASHFGVPFAAVNLVDAGRCFFKAFHGADVREVPRPDVAPCVAAMSARTVVVVPDARADERFREFALVAGEPHARFYATAPIEDPDGFVLGTLFIADTMPRELSVDEVRQLADYAGTAMDLLTAHRLATERATHEAALEEAETRYRALFDNSVDGVMRTSPDGPILEMNGAMRDMLGYTEADLATRRLHRNDVLDLDDPRLPVALEERRRTGRIRGVFTYRRKDGSTFPAEVTSGVYQDRDGTDRTVIIVRDITERVRREKALEESQERFAKTFRANPLPAAVVSLRTGRVIEANPAFIETTGYGWEELEARPFRDLGVSLDPERASAVLQAMASEGHVRPYDTPYRTKDGAIRHAELFFERIEVAGEPCLVLLARDVTDEKRVERSLHTRARQQAAVARLSHVVLTRSDLQGVLDEAARIVAGTLDVDLGGVLEVAAGGRALVLRSGFGWRADGTRAPRGPDAYSVAERMLESSDPVVFADVRADPRVSPRDRVRAEGIRSAVGARIEGRDGPFGVIAAFSVAGHEFGEDDASFLRSLANLLSGAVEQRLLLDELALRAEHDDLTGLPNRSTFLACLEGAIAEAPADGTLVAVLFLDLDRFKNINDSLGHHAGDELLESVSGRLTDLLREGDVLARLAGDEFVIMLSGARRKTEVAEITHRILRAFDRPFAVAGRLITVKATVGISIYPEDAEDATSLLRGADAAMYQGKSVGRNTFQFFTPEMNAMATERLDLESDLRQALHRNEFELHYQPQVNLDTRNVLGFEALLRWHHPTRGLVPPDRFIPIAEDTGLIVAIGEWVMREAFGQLKAWKDAGAGWSRMSVNVAAPQFTQVGFTTTVQRITEECGLRPDDVELEITESVVLHDADLVAKELTALEALGFRVAIDDFGTGYSSLAYLRDLPIDRIKIDRAFTRQIDGNASHGGIAFVEAILRLAGTLDLDVVAEGVETEEQVRVLRRLGCTEGQGYLFAKPMPAPDFLPWLERGVRP